MLPSSSPQVFDHNGARAFAVESKNGLAAEFLHHFNQIAASGLRQQIAVKGLSGQRACDGAIRADQPEIEAELLRDRQSEGVTASRDENDLDALGVSAPQNGEIGLGDLKLGIEQSAVDVDSNQAEGIGGHNRFYHSRVLRYVEAWGMCPYGRGARAFDPHSR